MLGLVYRSTYYHSCTIRHPWCWQRVLEMTGRSLAKYGQLEEHINNPVLGWSCSGLFILKFRVEWIMREYDYLRYQGFQVVYSHSSALPGSKQLNIAYVVEQPASHQLRRASFSFITGSNINSLPTLLPGYPTKTIGLVWTSLGPVPTLLFLDASWGSYPYVLHVIIPASQWHLRNELRDPRVGHFPSLT